MNAEDSAKAGLSREAPELSEHITELDTRSEESRLPNGAVAEAVFSPGKTAALVEVISFAINGVNGTGCLVDIEGMSGKLHHGTLRSFSPDYINTTQISVDHMRGMVQIDFRNERGSCTGILQGEFSGTVGNLPKTGYFTFTR